jgi:hypothetical protein
MIIIPLGPVFWGLNKIYRLADSLLGHGWKKTSYNKLPKYATDRLQQKISRYERRTGHNAYDCVFYSKGKHHKYKVWCETIAQGQTKEHYYVRNRHPKPKRDWEYLGKQSCDYDRHYQYPNHFPPWVQKAFEKSSPEYGEAKHFRGKNYKYKITTYSTSTDPPSRFGYKFYRKKRGK